jgi:hypothetical protein
LPEELHGALEGAIDIEFSGTTGQLGSSTYIIDQAVH